MSCLSTIKQVHPRFFFIAIVIILLLLINNYGRKLNSELCAVDFNPSKYDLSIPDYFKYALKTQTSGIPRIYNNDSTLNFAKTWENIPEYFSSIWSDARKHLKIQSFPSDNEELKYFLEFKQKDAECHIITIGIGGIITPEQLISQLYPQCTFVGVDPDDFKALYESIPKAKYVQGAIRGETQSKTFNIGIIDFLMNYTQVYNNNNIDMLLMDPEGAEYDIIEKLLTINGSTNKSLPTICQMNMELHTIHNSSDYERRLANLDKLLENFAIVKADFYKPRAYIRAFFVNYVNPLCIQKFLS